MNKFQHWIVIFALTLLFSGCASVDSTSKEYVLSSIDGETPNIQTVTLTLTDDDLHGNGPINFWQASVQYDKVGPMIITRRGGPEHEMQFESKLLQLLEGSELDDQGDKLVFTKEKSQVTFTRAQP